MPEKHIIAGSGGFVFEYPYLHVGPILKYAINISKKKQPKICLIATALGDDSKYISDFYNAVSEINALPSHLQLFPMPNHDNIEEFILSQDIIWVAGGSVVNLLSVWRAHGLDTILRKAWEAGVILTGQNAGSICWGKGGTTDSFGKNLKAVNDGIELLPYSSGVHYDSEKQRRPLYQKLILDREIPDGYATDDGVNIHFINDAFHKAVSDRPEKFAYKVYTDGDKIVEEVIEPTLLM